MTKMDTKPLDSEELVKNKLQELIDFRKDGQDIREFWGKQFDLGLAWVQFPEGAGGLGVNPKYQLLITDTLRNEGISQQNKIANILGIGMGAPTIVEYGTPEQISTYLRPMFTTEEIWCQLFSEPGSGSDLASLKTKAIKRNDLDEDYYVVNGAKTWTTLAQNADWIFCLVRTDNSGIKQEGISFLLIDMKSPGIEVKPIITIDGDHEVNTVFFSDVKVPAKNLIGEEGKGWTYAKFLLAHERFGIAAVGSSMRELNRLKKIVNEIDNNDLRKKVSELEVSLSALEITELRLLSELENGGHPGAESSILKIKGTEMQQKISELFVEASGEYALMYPGPHGYGSNDKPAGPDYAANSLSAFLNLRKTSIYGGSNEIQKNILSKFVLGV